MSRRPSPPHVPFLRARWTNLILATYRVEPAALLPHLPPGCRLDLAGGHALASLVAFDFTDCQVLGVRWPGFVNFPEVNLRFYVRHGKGSTERRGVVFVCEFVPQRTVAALARWTYNEPYRAVPDMRSRVGTTNGTVTVEHSLTVAGRPRSIRLTADADASAHGDDSAEAFLIEHQWGFGTSRFRRRLIEYQVVHEPWRVHRVRSFTLDWDWAAAYGPAFAALADAEPASVVLAAGSDVSVWPRGRVGPVRPSRPPGPAAGRAGHAGHDPMSQDAPTAEAPSKSVPAAPHPIVLFDGQCNLCNAAVNFIVAHDSRDRFRFASLQSDLAAGLLRQHGLPSDLDTVVMIDGDHAFTHSTAVLRIAAELDAPWPLAALAALVPRQLRDDAYAFVSKHRTQWFGRRQACRMPTDKDRDRFLV